MVSIEYVKGRFIISIRIHLEKFYISKRNIEVWKLNIDLMHKEKGLKLKLISLESQSR